MPPDSEFNLITTAQVERTYVVKAQNEEQARTRLRTHMKDPEMLREGIVTKLPQDKNTTPEKIKRAEPKPKPAPQGAVSAGKTPPKKD